MSDASRAVFLSYASQDADAARRICDALRAAGVEVWFDQSELRGGDAWDAKIRKQSKDCALFVPIISANTQARAEGYFRLEWKLAADRSHLIARDHPFLVPLAIDDTPNASARVPEEFHAVQWTRLSAGEATAGFATRVNALLAAPDDVAAGEAKSASASRAGAGVTRGAGGRRLPKFLERVRVLHDRQHDASRDDWELAEELGVQATKLSPADPQAWVACAPAMLGSYRFGYKASSAQLTMASDRAERALSLAPDSMSARLVVAECLQLRPQKAPEAERILRELLGAQPEHPAVLLALAHNLRLQRRLPEALAVVERPSIATDAKAVALKGAVYVRMGRLDLAEQATDELLRIRPGPFAYLKKALYCAYWHDDFEQAAALLKKVPGSFLFKDEGALLAAQVHLWRNQPGTALTFLKSVGQDYLAAGRIFNHSGTTTTAPKEFLVGQAHLLAGRAEAANLHWGIAIEDLSQRLLLVVYFANNHRDPRMGDLAKRMALSFPPRWDAFRHRGGGPDADAMAAKWREAYEMDPRGYLGALTHEARVWAEAGRNERARAILQEIEPQLPRLSPYYRAMRDYAQALSTGSLSGQLHASRQLINCAPGTVGVRGTFLQALLHSRRPREIIDYLDLLRADSPGERARYYGNRVWANIMLGDFEGALTAARQRRKVEPNESSSIEQEATALGLLGRIQELETVWQSTLTLRTEYRIEPIRVAAAGLRFLPPSISVKEIEPKIAGKLTKHQAILLRTGRDYVFIRYYSVY